MLQTVLKKYENFDFRKSASFHKGVVFMRVSDSTVGKNDVFTTNLITDLFHTTHTKLYRLCVLQAASG